MPLHYHYLLDQAQNNIENNILIFSLWPILTLLRTVEIQQFAPNNQIACGFEQVLFC